MINPFFKKMLLAFARFRIVHSEPGLMELNVSGLETIRYFAGNNGEIPLNYDFYKPYGIKNIAFSPQTSNLLIEYDPSVLRENQVVNMINRIKELAIEKFNQGKSFPQIIEEIKSEFKNQGHTGNSTDPDEQNL